MRTTITIRAGERLKAALEQRARAEGQSVSELVRQILGAALEVRPLGQKVGRLRGQLQPARRAEPWRAALAERNWRE